MEPITVNGPASKPSGSTKWRDYNKKNNFLVDVKKVFVKKMAHF